MDDENFSQVMQSRIIKLVPKIELKGENDQVAGMVEQLFRAIVAGELSQLKEFSGGRFEDINLSSIEAELFSEAVIRLEDCFLSRSTVSLSTDQHRAILDKIIETEDLKLKKYDVNQRHLSGVPADIIMTAAVKLEMTRIYGSLRCF